MTQEADESYFGPKHLKQTTLHHFQFIENGQAKLGQHYFRSKFTTFRTTTTITFLNKIHHTYHMPEVFMADGGSQFAWHDVAVWYLDHGLWYEQVAAYSPWVNSLLKGTNRKLLLCLKRLCAPDLGEDEYAKIVSLDHLPSNWPDIFNTAIEQQNRSLQVLLKPSMYTGLR